MANRKVTTLVIDRAKWGTEYLLNSEGTMCCLGFLALKCGADLTEIDEESSPKAVPNVDWPAELIKIGRNLLRVGKFRDVIQNSELTMKMMEINDDSGLKWSDKEKKLIPLFKKAGIKLSFKGPKKKDWDEDQSQD
jgi:hypothetical protein